MKFLCDRCKTRYSIGDERVRGKILKIRCKNCANVITVREGMPEPDAVPASGARRNKTTTAAPVVSESPNGALGAAFAKPPPALEEEWYVSIDGDQAGPFSLAEAQRWVASKPIDAELHCWSEGFDDWLPVDKVSHFRGLRKKPAPPPTPAAAMPPPIPRITGTGPARAIATRIPEEEHTPKPLFAATMASLEKSAPVSASASSVGGGAAAVGALRVEARNVATPVPSPAKPLNGGSRPVVPATIARPAGSEPGRGGGLRSAGFVAARPAFDPSDVNATQAESPPFTDEQPTTADPVAVAAAAAQTKPAPHLKSVTPDTTAAPNDAFLDALAKERRESKSKEQKAAQPMLSLASMAANEAPTLRADQDVPAPKPPDPTSVEGDDDMEIGEVSRVVKLADLARPRATTTSATAKRTGAVAKITGPVGRVTGSTPRINGTGALPLMDAVDSLPGANPPMAVDPAAEPVQAHSKRGLVLLLVGAALLLGAAAVILVLKLNTPEDVTGLGGQFEYNPERPDNPIARRPGDVVGPGSAEEPQNPFIPKPVKPPPKPQTNPNPPKPDPPAGNSLKSDEIEAMARSTSSTTTICFRRASKGADDIILADVKKIRVAFHVNPDGSVNANSVDLSEKRSATLASCIQRMVAGWKFRPNSGGDFGFVFAKPD